MENIVNTRSRSPRNTWCGVRINAAGYVVSGAIRSHIFRPLVDYDLWFAWSGHAEMVWRQQSFAIDPGVIMCLRYQQEYETRFNPETPVGHCYVHFDFLDDAGNVVHPAEPDLPPHYSQTRDIEFTYLTLRRVADLCRSQRAQALDEAHCYLRGLLLSLVRSNPRQDVPPLELEHRRRIAELIHYIREDPSRGFSVARIAERGHYSADYFTKVFKQIHGTTPTRFFIGIRLERACALLSETTLNMEQIAEELGYADVFFFSRQFKQHFGMAPSRWRQNRQGLALNR